MGCFEILGQVNYLAVLVCTIVAMALGALWYSPVLFGNAWMKAAGLKEEDIKKGDAGRGMIVSAITTFIEMVVLASLLIMIGTTSMLMGIHMGALVSVGIIAMVMLSNAMFHQTSRGLWGINAGYRIVYFVINGAILAVW